MKAGRELDALIAEKVMGWTKKELPTNRVNPSYTAWYWVSNDDNVKIPTNFFNPSINLHDAWQVVEKLKKDNIYIDIYSLPSDGYRVETSTHDGEQYVHMSTVGADTAPLAICLAALKAVGVEIDD